MKKRNFINLLPILALGFLLLVGVLGCFQNFSDKTKPELTLLGKKDLVMPMDSLYVEPGFYAYDVEDGFLTKKVLVDDSELNLSVPGSYLIYYSVIDRYGNESEPVTRKVTIIDSQSKITLVGDSEIHLEAGGLFIEPGFTAIDNDGADISNKVSFDSYKVVKTNKPGLYLASYSVQDSWGAVKRAQRKIYITLPKKPIIILNGNGRSKKVPPLLVGKILNINSNLDKLDPGFEALDKKLGDVTNFVTVKYSEIDTEVLSNGVDLELKYELNIEGRINPVATAIRYIQIVNDALPPIITMNQNSSHKINYSLELGDDAYVELGAISIDKTATGTFINDCSVSTVINQMEGSIVLASNIEANKVNQNPGEYNIVYSSVDNSGNVATAIRTIKVVDTKAPKVSIAGSEITAFKTEVQNLAFGTDPLKILADAVATDNDPSFKIKITGDKRNEIDTRKVGTYTTLFYSKDRSGNEAPIARRIVNIQIPIKPPIQNGSFEDYGGDIGKIDEETSLFSGWYWDMKVYCRESNIKVSSVLSLVGGVFGHEHWKDFTWPDSTASYKFGGPMACSDEGYKQNYAGVSDKLVKTGTVSAWSAGNLQTDEEDIVKEIDIYDLGVGIHLTFYNVKMDGPNFYLYTWGSLAQDNIAVQKGVSYRFRAALAHHYYNIRQQDVYFQAVAETPGMKLSPSSSKVSYKYVAGAANQDQFNEVSFIIKPTMDGTIRLEFYKGVSYNGNSQQGVDVWYDDVRAEVIGYAQK